MAVFGADIRVSTFVPYKPRANRVPFHLRPHVAEKIAQEIDKGWLVPVEFNTLPSAEQWAVAPLQVVEEPTKLRVVTDYSDVVLGVRTGINGSVDMVSLGEAFMHRCTDLARAIHDVESAAAGSVPLLLVRDLSKAFRRIGVSQQDVPKLHTCWESQHLWDTRLPFGHAASAHLVCDLTRAIADELTKLYAGRAVCLCYVDDFIIVSSPAYASTAEHLFDAMLCDLGLPVSAAKATRSGSWSTTNTWIGYIHDTVHKTHALAEDKLRQVYAEIQHAIRQPRVSVVLIRSMVGRMNHAANVCMPARAFLRRLTVCLTADAAAGLSCVTITPAVREDLHWWLRFLPTMPLAARMMASPCTSVQCIATDASLTGAGGVLYSALRPGNAMVMPRWRHTRLLPAPNSLATSAVAFPFCSHGEPKDMAVLEAFAACEILQHFIERREIQPRSDVWLQLDNQALVMVLRKGRARDARLNNVVRRLLSLCIATDVRLYPFHVFSQENEWPDLLSRSTQAGLQRLVSDCNTLPVQWLCAKNWTD